MMQIHTLNSAPHLRDSTLELIEKYFPKGDKMLAPLSVADEFVLLLDPANAARTYVFAEGDKVLATASYRSFAVEVPGFTHPFMCAGIGLVVTDPAAERKGCARELQQEIERAARDEGCLISLLWSDLAQFYTKLGYALAGAEWQWTLDHDDLTLLRSRLNAEVSNSVRVEKMTDWQQVAALYEAQRMGPRRSPRDVDKLLRLPNTWAWAAYDSAAAAEPTAYAILGKGRDLRDTLHEIVGKAHHVGPLLRATMPQLEKCLRVHQPLLSPLRAELEHWLGPAEKGALAFMKILHTKKLLTWLSAGNVLPQGVRAIPREGFGFCLDIHAGVFFESAEAANILQLFFGPWEISELIEVPKALSEHLRSTKIVPLYFWGFDSV